MAKTKELDPLVMNGTAHGFGAAPSTRTVKANPEQFPKLTPAEGLDWFEADIRDDLTILQQRNLMTTGPWEPIFRMMAPWVVRWNASEQNAETGEWQPLPPPAEAGWEVFERVNTHLAAFRVMAFTFGVGTDLPKGLKTSSATDDGEGGVT